MLDFLINIDTQIFLFFNSLHLPFFDHFMMTFSGKWIWVPMYVSILYILFRRYDWKVAMCYTFSISLVIVCSDQLCATFIRPWVERLRPTHIDNPISDFVHVVDGYRGGKYGFPSCHAANSFALASFLAFLFANRRFTIFILLWAFVNSYSRLYLGVHYPGDLIIGAIVGGLIGYVGYRVGNLVSDRLATPRDYEHHRFYAQLSLGNTSFTYQLSDIMIATGSLIVAYIGTYALCAWL